LQADLVFHCALLFLTVEGTAAEIKKQDPLTLKTLEHRMTAFFE